MNAFMFLMRREFWENRGAFLIAPLSIGGFFVGSALLAISAAAILVTEINGNEFLLGEAFAKLKDVELPDLDKAADVALFSLTAIFNVALFFIVFFYLLGSLYDDRRDRSILFWKSLPVSDAKTVASKLVAATILAPVLCVFAIAVTHLALMTIATFMAWNAGLGAWEYVWGPADPLDVWALMLGAYAVQALWMLPVWGWLLLASAFAKSKPFLWAVVPPITLAVMQSWFNLTRYFRWDDNWVWMVIGERMLGGVVPLAIQIDGEEFQVGSSEFNDDGFDSPISWSGLGERFSDPDLYWGLIVAAVFVAAAVWIRRYRDDA
jgi:ABC-2 type transport system permease protein